MQPSIDPTQELLQNRRLFAHRSFFSYACDLLRRTKFVKVWRELLAYFRRIRMVTWTVRILSVVFSVLQTGALVILSTVIFLIILPILASLMLGILLTAFFESRKSNRKMELALSQKRIYVLFLSKKDNPFLAQNARDLAQHKGAAVLLISPYWLSGKGLFSKRFYATVRHDGEGIYLVRRYYFFKLKKKVLSNKEAAYLF